jgi:hypothetical protein
MFVFKKNDDHLAAMESYKDFITKKEIIIPREGVDEYYYVIYCNFVNPITVLKDDSLFSISLELIYTANVANVVDQVNIDFKFVDLINNKIVSDIDRFYILDDERILVDISGCERNAKIEKFVSELNKNSCKEIIRKSSQWVKNIINSVDDSLEKK